MLPGLIESLSPVVADSDCGSVQNAPAMRGKNMNSTSARGAASASERAASSAVALLLKPMLPRVVTPRAAQQIHAWSR